MREANFSVIRDVENGRVPAMSPQSLGQFGPLGKGYEMTR